MSFKWYYHYDKKDCNPLVSSRPRLSDNPALTKAAENDEVIPIYILDDNNAGNYAMRRKSLLASPFIKSTRRIIEQQFICIPWKSTRNSK